MKSSPAEPGATRLIGVFLFLSGENAGADGYQGVIEGA